jgi:hypothetical protein
MRPAPAPPGGQSAGRRGWSAVDRRLRRQRQCKTIWRLGARIFFELIDELARHHTLHDLDARLERYARLDPDVIRALQADRFPQPIRLIASERPTR